MEWFYFQLMINMHHVFPEKSQQCCQYISVILKHDDQSINKNNGKLSSVGRNIVFCGFIDFKSASYK